MDLAAVMEEVGVALDAIPGLNVHPWGQRSATPPAAMVTLPARLAPNATAARGVDKIEGLGVLVMVGQADLAASVQRLAAYCEGSGPESVIAAVQDHDYGAVADHATVTEVTFDGVTFGGPELLAATFMIDIWGHGA